MVTVLRPLSTSELLDRTFHLYRNKFLVFVGIMAIPQLFVLALHMASAATMTTGALGGVNPWGILAGFASFIAIEISHAATVMAVSNYHLEQPVTVGSAFSQARSSMARVAGISLAIGIGVGIASIFLLIPGIYLAIIWSLAIPVTVLEGGGLNPSTTRSKELTKGGRGRIFVIGLLLIVLVVVVSLIFQIPLGIVTAVMTRGNPNAIMGAAGTIVAVSAIGTFVSTSLVGPLATIALTLVYYDQRVRKEGFDLQLMMSRLDPNAAAAAAASSNL